jgi:two-component sensor histidine kinase
MRLSARLMAIRYRARVAVHDELAPLAHPSTFSWRVAVVFAVISGPAQMVYDAEFYEMPIARWAAPTAGSIIVFFVVLAAFGHLSRRRRLSPVQVVLCLVVAGSARTLSVGAIAMSLEVVDSMDWAFRVTGGILLSPALLIVIASGFVRHDVHLAIVTELQVRRDHLLDVGQSIETALTRAEDEITMAVRAAIAPALDALDTVLDRVITDASSQPAVAALAQLVDDEVRPISHRLATQNRYVPTFIDQSRHPRRIRVPLPSRVTLADGVRPVFVAVMFFSVAAPTVVRYSPFDEAVIRLLWSAFVSCLVLSVLKAMLRPIRTPAVMAVGLVAGVHALAQIFTVPFLQGDWLPLSQGERLVGVQVATVVGVMTTVAVVVDARRTATQSELARVVADLNAVVEMMGRRARLASTRLAHVLHGSLQGALHAAAIRLNEATRPDAALVQTIRNDIASALERIDDRSWGGAGLRHTLDEIVATWSGHRALSVDMEPESAKVLARDRDADAATAEVVREAVNNALRHGQARSVFIEVRLIDNSEPSSPHRQWVQISVTDDGVGWPSGAYRGLGTILYDDLCTSWRHVDTGSGTQLIATVGVQGQLHSPSDTVGPLAASLSSRGCERGPLPR